MMVDDLKVFRILLTASELRNIGLKGGLDKLRAILIFNNTK
jgi:hypothetical protein